METIKSSQEISNLFSNGKSYSNRYVSFLIGERQSQQNNSLNISNEHDLNGRVAFIAGKKHGNAVWRNSAKRRLREISRQLGGPWANYDVIFIAKPRILKESYSKVLQECEKTLKKCSIAFVLNEGSTDE